MPATVAFLPSALLGPAVWRPVARLMAARGWEVVEIPRPARPPVSPQQALATYLAALPEDRRLVLVPHSNAGAFVPDLIARRQVEAVVFVDAGLPPASGDVLLAPPELQDFLAGLADANGLLPPWTEWWGDEGVDTLFPGDSVRREVTREQHCLPLSYFSATLTAAPGWDAGPGGYLAFGETYADDRSRAATLGWPVRTLPGGHLHMLMAPVEVADALTTLLDRLS